MKHPIRFAMIAVVGLAALLALPTVASAQGTLFVNNDMVGINVDTPENKLHVKETAAGNEVMGHFENNGAPIVEYEDTSLGIRWGLNPDGLGNFVITLFGSGGPEFKVGTDGSLSAGPGSASNLTLDSSGNLDIAGTLTQGSSRSLKEGFAELNATEVLDKVSELEVLEWSYTDQASRHIGPMAEDFRATFGTGPSDTSLAPADVAGVTLVALQGLNEIVEQKNQEIERLSVELGELRKLVEELANR